MSIPLGHFVVGSFLFKFYRFYTYSFTSFKVPDERASVRVSQWMSDWMSEAVPCNAIYSHICTGREEFLKPLPCRRESQKVLESAMYVGNKQDRARFSNHSLYERVTEHNLRYRDVQVGEKKSDSGRTPYMDIKRKCRSVWLTRQTISHVVPRLKSRDHVNIYRRHRNP